MKNKIVKVDENIFEALEVKNSAYEKIRLDLMLVIRKWFKKSGLNQQDAAKALCCTQPQISAVLNTKYEEFTIDRLVKMVSCIGKEVEIKVLEVA
jgi:predicted XRE-type DNA-binding protein